MEKNARNSTQRGGAQLPRLFRAVAQRAGGRCRICMGEDLTLKTITAFQYHIWADNRGEGGLRLGLRKFGDDPQVPFGKKPSWDVYQAAGTDQWERATAFAKPIIGIKDGRGALHGRDTLNERARVRHTCGHYAAPWAAAKSAGKRISAQGHLKSPYLEKCVNLVSILQSARQYLPLGICCGNSCHLASDADCRV